MENTMSKVKVAIIDGACRADSSSRKLVYLAPEYFLTVGAEVEIFDQSKEHLPLFDDTDEGAENASVVKLLNLIESANAVVFSSCNSVFVFEESDHSASGLNCKVAIFNSVKLAHNSL